MSSRAFVLAGCVAFALAAATVAWRMGAPAEGQPTGPRTPAGLSVARSSGAPSDLEPGPAPTAPSALVGAPDGRSMDAAAASAPRAAAGQDQLVQLSIQARDSGAPVAEAQVTLSDGEQEARGASDETGRLELLWDGAPGPRVSVTHPGYLEARLASLALEGLQSIELDPAATLFGRVLANGSSLPEGIEVLLWGSDPGRAREPLAQAPTDEVGNYRFEGLEPGTYAVGVAHPDVPLLIEGGLQLSAQRPTQVNLLLPRGSSLVGRVVTAVSRAPIEGVQVTSRPDMQGVSSRLEELGSARAVTGSDGMFRLGNLPEGVVRVEVRTPWGHRQVQTPATGVGSEAKPFEIVLAAPATLAGTVLTPAGQVVPGAEVVLCLEDEMRRYSWLRPQDLPRADPNLRFQTADGLGRFDFGHVPASHSLFVYAWPKSQPGGVLEPGSTTVRLSSGNVKGDLSVELREGYPLEGRVLDPEGQPIAGAQVSLHSQISRGWSRVGEELETDSLGRFRSPRAPAGSIWVRVEAEGYSRGGMRVQVGPELGPVDIELQPAGVLRGLVVDELGRAVADVSVRATPQSGSNRRGRRSDSTDDWGHFEIQALSAGTWKVSISSAEWELIGGDAPIFESPGSAELTLILAPRIALARGILTGEVMQAGARGPIPGLRFDGLRSGTVRLDGTRFRITGVRPGQTVLKVNAQGFETRYFQAVELAPRAELDVGSLELRRTSRLTVTVVNAAGQPVQHARVQLQRVPAAEGGRGFGPSALKPNGRPRGGRYEFLDVPRYRWRLDVRASGFSNHAEVVTLKSGRMEHTVKLEPRRKKR